MSTPEELRERLQKCPAGRAGWRDFEKAALEVLRYLFVPPLNSPYEQVRSYSGIDRRDAVFPNRNRNRDNHWGHLFQELDARMILIEFKNYDAEEVGKEETNQTRDYMRRTMGRLAILVCNREPNHAAHIKRNSIYGEEQKLILFLTTEHLVEMLYIKERGEDPADLVMDAVERFYMQFE